MKKVFTGAKVYRNGRFVEIPFCVSDGRVVSSPDDSFERVAVDGCYIFPGFADVHVHLREPGFSYKETVKSGTLAAAAGGYTAVCSMPNLSPVPDCAESLKLQLDAIKKDAVIRVYPYGAITVGEKGRELSGIEAMANDVCAYTDDGKGVQSEEMMRSAMLRVKALGKILAAHCEDESLLFGGCIHDGGFARENDLPGICSESEYGQVARDIALVRETGCSYHVCHVSTAESVELIRKAKAEGLDVTCETAPHYLLLNDSMLMDEGRFKMNPPIRAERDRLALIEGIKDGTVDMIATDHAPHSVEEKSKGLRGSLMGVSGLEAAFPVMWTGLVQTGVLTPEELARLMCVAPRKRFSIPGGTSLGDEADFCIIDPKRRFKIDASRFVSCGKATPFDGYEVRGKVILTAVKGETVFSEL